MTDHESLVLRPRLVVYAALMLLCLGTLGVSLATRTPFEANIFRARGSMPFIIDGDVVRDPFEVHVFNKNTAPARFSITLRCPVEAQVIIGTPELELQSLTDAHVPVSVSIARSQLQTPVDLVLVVTDQTNGTSREKTIRFLGK